MKKTTLMLLLLPMFWFTQSCDDPKTASKNSAETRVDVMKLSAFHHNSFRGR